MVAFAAQPALRGDGAVEAEGSVSLDVGGREDARAVRESGSWILVEVADDGVGGADARCGSGLRGLEDRVAVLDGTLSIDSPSGGGTRLRVELPLRERRFAWAKVTA